VVKLLAGGGQGQQRRTAKLRGYKLGHECIQMQQLR
jgi:hypothetical protein